MNSIRQCTAMFSAIAILASAVLCFGTPQPIPRDPVSNHTVTLTRDGKRYQTQIDTHRWGVYTVTVRNTEDMLDDDNHGTLTIADQRGKVVKRIESYAIESVSFQTLRRGGAPSLCFAAWNGCNGECCHRSFAFSYAHGLHNMLACPDDLSNQKVIWNHGDANYWVSTPAPLLFFLGYDRYACGSVQIALDRVGDHYVMRNRRHKDQVRGYARQCRLRLLEAESSQGDVAEIVGPAIECCANLYTIGEGKEYFPWFRKHMSKEAWRLFLQLQPRLRICMKWTMNSARPDERDRIVFHADELPWFVQ